MVHDSSIRALKVVANGNQHSAGFSLVRIVSEVESDVARVVTLEECHHVIDAADGKEDKVLTL